MKVTLATVLLFLGVAMAAAVPEAAANDPLEKRCTASGGYCAANSVCCSNSCIGALNKFGGYCS